MNHIMSELKKFKVKTKKQEWTMFTRNKKELRTTLDKKQKYRIEEIING